MSEAAVGRLLVASLHQAVADVLPSRVEFYEPWLNPAASRHGHSGLAPLAAALSFLRREGDAYGLVATRAGEYTADWTVGDLSRFHRRAIAGAPRIIRLRLVAGLADSMVHRTYGAAQLRIRWRRGLGTATLSHSLFCEVRERVEHPLCEFYATALGALLNHFSLDVDVATDRCRATEAGATVCSMSMRPRVSEAGTP